MKCRLMLTATAPSSFQNSSSWWKWRQKRWKLNILIRNIAKRTKDPGSELKILTKPHLQNMHLNLCQSQFSQVSLTLIQRRKKHKNRLSDNLELGQFGTKHLILFDIFFEHFLQYLSSTGMSKILFTEFVCQQFEIKYWHAKLSVCLFGDELFAFY